MKQIKILLGLFVIFVASHHKQVLASSLNGTAGIVYATTHRAFHDGEFVRGFVRLNNGFSIDPAASVLFDTFITVSGGIDLKDTGILTLNSDLNLESGVTLTTGGIINGHGHTIIMNGNVTLPATSSVRPLIIRSDTIFDGKGKTLTIGDRSQIFVEDNVTLTLCNLVLKSGPFFQTPPIMLASLRSKLALSNVVIDLGSNFDFRQGQIFIHNDVKICGTSSLIYRSPRPSYITSNGLLTFDIGTTFSMAPSTFTDGFFSNSITPTTSKFLVLSDASSTLFLNGSTLLTTYTGLTLTTGNLCFDNRVVLDSTASTSVSGISLVGSALTGLTPIGTAWSPDGRYIVVIDTAIPGIQMYKFNGSGAPVAVGASLATALLPVAVDWSPDGRFIAVISGTVLFPTLQIYAFNGSSTPTPVGGAVVTGLVPLSVSWSPDGRFLAVVNSVSLTLQIYSFDGVNTPTTVGAAVAAGLLPAWVDWSPDGRFLAVVDQTGNALTVYRFDGINTPVTVGGSAATGLLPLQVFWSPDGRFIGVINSTLSTLQIYRFNGVTGPTAVGGAAVTGLVVKAATWSPDGRFIAVVNGTGANIRLFQFDGSHTPTPVGLPTATGLVPLSVSWSPAWSPSGDFISVASSVGTSVAVYTLNYTAPISLQACSKSIVFGDPKLGTRGNLNVRFLGGAHVEARGKILEDSV